LEILERRILMLTGPDTLVILVIVLVLFGGKRISELGSGLGKGIRNFKKSMEEDETAPKKLEDRSEKDKG
jgi:sec-independent protein translocase protein TatA